VTVSALRQALTDHLGQTLTPEVQVDRVSPADLVETPGFSRVLDNLREEAELALFSDQPASFDLGAYMRLYEGGVLTVFSATQDGVLTGFAIVLQTQAPRRQGFFYVMDVIWAPKEGPTSKLLMLNVLRATEGRPLFITAPIGGRLHSGLLSSKQFRQTHAVFTSS
jgi:hypothetical protein